MLRSLQLTLGALSGPLSGPLSLRSLQVRSNEPSWYVRAAVLFVCGPLFARASSFAVLFAVILTRAELPTRMPDSTATKRRKRKEASGNYPKPRGKAPRGASGLPQVWDRENGGWNDAELSLLNTSSRPASIGQFGPSSSTAEAAIVATIVLVPNGRECTFYANEPFTFQRP